MFLNFPIFYILIYLLSNSTVLIAQQEHVECIADYLLLSKNIRTEIFAEKIADFEDRWAVHRGIQKMLTKELTNFTISKKEMANFMGENYANDCFGRNINLINLETTNESNINSDKVMIFEKITTIIGQNHLVLSKKFKENLEKQSFCLANLLFKIFGEESLEEIKVPIEQNKNEKIAIQDHYKLFNKYIFRWIPQDLSKVENQDKVLEGIKECSKHLSTQIRIGNKNQNEITTTLTNKDEFEKIYNRFNPEQFFFDKNPIVFDKNEIDDDCSICLLDKQIDQNLKKLRNCKHIFHYECIEPWIDEHNSCPICRVIVFQENNNIQNHQLQNNENQPNNTENQNHQRNTQNQLHNTQTQNHSRNHFRNIYRNIFRCLRP